MAQTITVAQLLVRKLAQAGVKKIFGLPGGGSSLDIIAAAAAEDIQFVLTKTENAAVMMAGALAETSGVPGVALMTKGPGLTNAANGVAYSSLDRAPVIVLTDGFSPKQLTYITHQVFDQQAVLNPLVKAASRLESGDPASEIDHLLIAAMTYPLGPVHIELTSETARSTVDFTQIVGTRSEQVSRSGAIDLERFEALRATLQKARKPIAVIGLEAREHTDAVRSFVESLGCAVLSTYKAKGVIPDNSAQVLGIFTGGSLEQEAIAAADLMVLIGMDPVELILQPWRYTTPVVDIAAVRHPVHYTEPSVQVVGSITETLTRLVASGGYAQAGWNRAELEHIRKNAQTQLAYAPVKNAVAPDRVAQLAATSCKEAGINPMFSIDAGAHMFSVAAFFPATRAGDVLISNGLATMAFALPAAISAAVQDPSTPVLCFTGDGGLMMCMGELCTAVEQQAQVIVIVFNDSALSLIDIKQQSRALESNGVRWQHHDFAGTMRALGGFGVSATTEQEFVTAMATALKTKGPSLIDVSIDPSGYPEQLKAMRG
ncbi:MAG: thiamine pyrophosphate-binding protein [Betaproteobacteria bacterium]